VVGPDYDIGYMNANHQRVVARGQTRFGRAPVMVIRCDVCGHYYGAAENRLIVQRCPRHDEGLDGQTAANEIDWLEPPRPHVSGLGLRSAMWT
jgi:hypothetical protein